MKLKILALAAALCFGWTSTQAQEYDYDPYPYGFVGVQGGAQMLLLNYDHMKLITPMAGVQVGGMFSPYLGARLSAQGMWTKHGFKTLDATFKHKYVMGTIDMLLNVSNFFTKNKAHRFNTYLVGGLGLNYSWGEEDAVANALSIHKGENVTHVLRVGLAEEVNLCRNLALNLEVDLNNIHDRYLSYHDTRENWQLTAALGLTYKFGFPKKVRKEENATSLPAAAPLSLYEQMQAGVNERMNTWVKRLKGESKDDYLNRTSEQSIATQRLNYTKAISTEMAGNRVNTSLKEMKYNKNSETLGVFFNDMPTITLKVPSSDIKNIKGKNDLRFTNTVYNLNPGDKFEVLYTEAITPQGKKYTYVKNADAKFVDNGNYMPLEVLHKDMSNQTRLQAIATNAVKEAKDKNILSDNTTITVSTEVLPTGNGKTDYRVSYKYTVKDAFSVQDDFAPGKYDADQAAASTAMLNIINKSLNEDFANYVKAGKAVEIRYIGSADAKPIHGRIAYNGKYGDVKAQPVNVNGQQENLTVTRAKGITSNEQLSLVRAISVQNNIKKNVPALKNMNVTESFNVEVSPNEGSQFRRVAVDFLFRDATLK